MSKQFWYLKETSSREDAFRSLKERGVNHVLEFFVESSEDRTWIEDEGIELMRLIYKHLVQQFRENRLSGTQAEKVAGSIQNQFKALQDILDYDVDFVIEGKTISIPSFMFEAESPFFKELIKKAKPIKGRKTLELTKVNFKFFDYINEFVTTGKIEFLWREEPKYILNFIRQAQKLGMPKMTAYSCSVYKRYLTPKNVIPHLKLAQREFLKDLENECCRFVNEQNFGIQVEYKEHVGLEVSLDHISEAGLALIDLLAKQISYLVLRGSIAENAQVVEILEKIPRLVGLDLSGTTAASEELLEKFPSVKQLNLSHCLWLNDERFLTIAKRCPGLVQLDLSRDTELSFRSLGEMTSLAKLSGLDLSYCDQLSDEDFDLVASSCPQLAILKLKFCRIGDAGLRALGRQCPGLKVLDLTDCKNVTREGIEELRAALPALELRFGDLNV